LRPIPFGFFGIDFYYYFNFNETNGKIHVKEIHHIQKAKGLMEDKPKSTKAPKFTKKGSWNFDLPQDYLKTIC
jgi:hypothetical protein